MIYAVEMCSGYIIYLPNFIKTGLSIHNLLWGIIIDTNSMVVS
jgi:hypothetical protein